MAEIRAQRRLAAILAADVVGYSRLMEHDEAGTLAALKARRNEVLAPTVAQHNGRVVKVMGDGVLVEFGSAVDAVQCAVELQKGFAGANQGVPEAQRIVLRIGINLGDVIIEGSDLYGDGVNIAARLESLAEPGGVCISAKVHEEARNKIDVHFESIGEQRLKNLSAAVTAFRWVAGDISPLARVRPQERARLSIAVLPFDNLSGDPGQQYISDGITEDITTELARFSGLSVASRLAAFHQGGKGRSPLEAARALAAAYVVEGSVRKAGAHLRITAQLIDARTGAHVWANRYDRGSEDVFAIQDEVVSSIVSMLESRMVATEVAIARHKPTASWSAYDFLLQGRELCDRNREIDAVPLFTRAIAIDPQFALAHAWRAVALVLSNIYSPDPGPSAEADASSKRALELDPNDANNQWARAMVLHWTGDIERAGRHFERALALNPADIQIKGDYANWQRLSGFPVEALASLEKLLAQGPFVPDWLAVMRGITLFDLKRYAEAVRILENLPHHYSSGFLYLAAGRAYLGDASGAATAIAKVRQLRPDLSLRDVPRVDRYARDHAQEHLMEGLRKAGLPE